MKEPLFCDSVCTEHRRKSDQKKTQKEERIPSTLVGGRWDDGTGCGHFAAQLERG
jgi:hypothetical protein